MSERKEDSADELDIPENESVVTMAEYDFADSRQLPDIDMEMPDVDKGAEDVSTDDRERPEGVARRERLSEEKKLVSTSSAGQAAEEEESSFSLSSPTANIETEECSSDSRDISNSNQRDNRETEERSSDETDLCHSNPRDNRETDKHSSDDRDLCHSNQTDNRGTEERSSDDRDLCHSNQRDNRETDKHSSDGRGLSDSHQRDTEDHSSDDAGFAILDRDSDDAVIAEQDCLDLDAEDSEDCDEDNEFSIVNRDSCDISMDDMDKDVCNSSHDISTDEEGVTKPLRRPVDLFKGAGIPQRKKAFSYQKAKRIENILSQDPVDLSELRQQAISRGGLINAELRQKAWPLLLNVSDIAPKPDEEILKGHRDYNQVILDVNRSIKRFPPGMEESHRLSLQDDLVDVIMRVLVRHPELHYYQGFHDICVTFLLVVNADLAFALVEKLSQKHLRDFMEPTMERTQQLLDYVPSLLNRANPQLLKYLEGAELGNVFCISWLLTWFGHVLNDIASILRIYDFFIACHPLMPVYVLGAVVLHREKEIFSTEQEMSELYQLLNKVPDNLPFEHLLSNAGDLYLQYPPTELANEAIKRFRRAQEEAAERRGRARSRSPTKRRASLLPDGNVTFTKVTCWMLGAVVSVAAYALVTGMEWDLASWT